MSWLRPANRSASVSGPFGPSKTYFFSTRSQGSSRRWRLSSSRRRVNSFSAARCARRALRHSSRETTLCVDCVAFMTESFPAVHGHTYPVCAMRVASLAAGLAPFRGLLLGVFFNAQQVAGPQLFEAAHPAFVDLPDGHDVQRVDALAAFLARVDQAGVAEHVDVLHDAEAGQVREGLDDRGRGAGALPQQIENCA